MLGQLGVHAVQADRVGDFTDSEASFIQDGDDAFVWLLHKVDNDLVVEVINLCKKSMIVKFKGNFMLYLLRELLFIRICKWPRQRKTIDAQTNSVREVRCNHDHPLL